MNKWLALLCFFPLSATGENGPDWRTFNVTVENDAFALGKSDKYFSSNIRLQLESVDFDQFNDSNTPKIFRTLFGNTKIFKNTVSSRSITYEIGQSIFTPADITIDVPQPDDLPYAGLLYGSAGFKARKETYADTIALLAGFVGPVSLAEQTQEFVHGITGSDAPKGWKHQLHNEPVLNLSYERRWQLNRGILGDSIHYELVGIGQAKLGNMLTGAELGGAVVISKYTSDVFRGASSMDPKSGYLFQNDIQKGPYCYFGGTGELTLRNIFLDGNTFRDSPDVDKNYTHLSMFLGVGYAISKWNASMSWTKETERFKTQNGGFYYGSISVSYRF